MDKCEELKVSGWRHSLFYGDSSPVYSLCLFMAKYKLKIVLETGKTTFMKVCGTHKNSIIRHSLQVGYAVEVINSVKLKEDQ